MIWLIAAAALFMYLMVKWSILAVYYMAVGICLLGVATFRLMTNRWPV